jgi:hypothetical protein
LTRTVLGLVLLCTFLLAGCFEWTEDPQGHLQTVGVAGATVWKTSAEPHVMTPTDVGFTPDEAAKMSGPVLVQPVSPTQNRYRFYPTGQNHCEEDLQKLLAQRGLLNSPQMAPYCTDKPIAPSVHGSGMIF